MARIRKYQRYLRFSIPRHSENFRVPIRLLQTAFGLVFEKFIERSENGSGSAGVNANVKVDFVIEKMGVALSHHAEGAAIDVDIRGQGWKIDVSDRHRRPVMLVVCRERKLRAAPHCAG